MTAKRSFRVKTDTIRRFGKKPSFYRRRINQQRVLKTVETQAYAGGVRAPLNDRINVRTNTEQPNRQTYGRTSGRCFTPYEGGQRNASITIGREQKDCCEAK